jgi:N-acetyl sugar amidotransferase
MRYCSRCIIPDTRPNILIGEDGVCNACRAHGTKRDIDWAAREKAFRAVVQQAKSRTSGYDCIIPVSGGKDSTWQVVRCLEYGLTPLAVTWKSPARTEIGRRNLENLVRLGVDHVDYQISPKTERILMRRALTEYGSTAIPMHLAIFGIPLKLAVGLGIPLVVLGENSAFEYGTKDEALTGFKLDARWLRTFGVTQGTTAADWVSPETPRRSMEGYFAPNDATLESAGVLAVFLGYYFQWDPEETRRIAAEHGFVARQEGPRTGYYDYADIDDDFISIHHYLKWYKFGFTRTFDNLSLEIRNGRLSRKEAVEIVRARGDETPYDDINKLCDFMEMSSTSFFEIIERFRNLNVWKRIDGRWVIPDFLIADRKWT